VKRLCRSAHPSSRFCERVRATGAADPAFTESLWRRSVSEWVLDAGLAKIISMDIVSVLIAAVMFAVLIALIYGIERI
jgi:hypothetical protein